MTYGTIIAVHGLDACMLELGCLKKPTGAKMRIKPVEISSAKTNLAVLRHPGRKFPGVLIQGDSLFALCRMADEACTETGQSEPGFWLNRLRDALQSTLDDYKNALNEHGIPMPFDDGSHPVR